MEEERNITEIPSAWVILKINTKGLEYYKVFASWNGGYLDGDRWKMNSGITNIEEDSNNYYIYGETGSCYKCNKTSYKVSSSYNEGILESILSNAYKVNTKIKKLNNEELNELLNLYL